MVTIQPNNYVPFGTAASTPPTDGVREQANRIRKMTVPHLLDYAQKRQWLIEISPNGVTMDVKIKDKTGKIIGRAGSINDNERTFAMALVQAAGSASENED